MLHETLDAAAGRHHFAVTAAILPRAAPQLSRFHRTSPAPGLETRLAMRQRSFFHRTTRTALLLGTLLSLPACGNARAEAALAQELNDAAGEISGLKNDVADLNSALDSLRAVVARQDTLINRIAAVNNIPR